jgi:hypothetical protein
MYLRRAPLLASLVAVLGLLPGMALGSMVFPETGVYSQNFDGPLGTEWTLSRWTTATVPAQGAARAQTLEGTAPAGIVTPPNPSAILPPHSFSSYGLSGNWLTNLARGGVLGTAPPGTARLEFTDLPAHDRVDLDLLLAVGDTIDGTDKDGPLTILVDGKQAFQFRFNSGGANLPQQNGIVRLTPAGGDNLTAWYWEGWKTGAQTINDRTAYGWTLDSVYNMNAFTGFTVPHTGSTLTIEFLHELDADHTDEYFAIDNLTVTLLPEPSAGLLALTGVGIAIAWRRRAVAVRPLCRPPFSWYTRSQRGTRRLP